MNPSAAALANVSYVSEQRPLRRTADILVDVLVAHGVEMVFGLPGGAISPMHDALLSRPEIRVVNSRLEGGAMFAAAGYARITGKLAVVLVTSGPGVLNTMTGLASAFCDGLPVLVLAGEVSRARYGQGALQEGSAYHLNIVQMARSISKLSLEIHDAKSAPAVLSRGITTALSGRRGPVLMTLPIDISTTSIRAAEITSQVSVECTNDDAGLASAAAAIRTSQRPLILAGSGTRWGDGPTLLRRFAEALQAPVMTTPKAKGVLPENHPLSLGVFGFGCHPSSLAYLNDGVDTLIVVGSGLSEMATNGWSPLLAPQKHFIQIDVDLLQIGKTYPITHGLVGSAEATLSALIRRMGPLFRPKRQYGIRYNDNPALIGDGEDGRISPKRAVWELQQAMPADTYYSCDLGEHMLYALHYLKINDPQGFSLMIGLGSMGSGIGAAVGIKLARPNRPVAAICGDGCFSMCLGDVATAVREKIPFVLAVMNDERYGMCEIGHQAVYGHRAVYPAGPMDVVAVSQALGARAFRVEHAGELMALDLAEQLQGGPVVIDIKIDRTTRMPNSRNDVLSSGQKVFN